MKTKWECVWSVDLLKGRGEQDLIVGTFSTKAKALEAIEYWATDGEYKAIDIDSKCPFNGEPCIVNIERDGRSKHEMLFIHKLILDNGAILAHIKYEK